MPLDHPPTSRRCTNEDTRLFPATAPVASVSQQLSALARDPRGQTAAWEGTRQGSRGRGQAHGPPQPALARPPTPPTRLAQAPTRPGPWPPLSWGLPPPSHGALRGAVACGPGHGHPLLPGLPTSPRPWSRLCPPLQSCACPPSCAHPSEKPLPTRAHRPLPLLLLGSPCLGSVPVTWACDRRGSIYWWNVCSLRGHGPAGGAQGKEPRSQGRPRDAGDTRQRGRRLTAAVTGGEGRQPLGWAPGRTAGTPLAPSPQPRRRALKGEVAFPVTP